jgi:hypothetical protein
MWTIMRINHVIALFFRWAKKLNNSVDPVTQVKAIATLVNDYPLDWPALNMQRRFVNRFPKKRRLKSL